MSMETVRFHPLRPGASFDGDWYPGTVPTNATFGEGCATDSTFCFKHFFSKRPDALRLGDHVTLWRTALSLEEDAQLEIGSYSYLANASIVCASRIVIGSYVMIAGGVTIADSDFHPMQPAQRLADTVALSPVGKRHNRPAVEASPVTIGDDVWIGPNVTVLKGVTVGVGAVIRPGSVVLRDVPDGMTVAGNPAKAVKE